MEGRRFFTDERCSRVEPLLLKVLGRGPRGDARRFFEAVSWILRSGATRYEETALSYLGAVAAAAWLVAITGWQG